MDGCVAKKQKETRKMRKQISVAIILMALVASGAAWPRGGHSWRPRSNSGYSRDSGYSRSTNKGEWERPRYGDIRGSWKGIDGR